MRLHGLVAIAVIVLLAGCQGRVPDATAPEPTAPSPVSTTPTAPLDCPAILEDEAYQPVPAEAQGQGGNFIVAAIGGSSCSWINSATSYVTFVVIPLADSRVPDPDCVSTDDGFGDHLECRFDAWANGYRFSGFAGGANDATEAEVLKPSLDWIAAFTAMAEAAPAGVAPPLATPAPGCRDLSVGGLSLSDGYVGISPIGRGPSLTAEVYDLAGAVSCQTPDSSTRVLIVPSVPEDAADVIARRGVATTVDGADLAFGDGDTSGSSVSALSGDTLVTLGQSGASREQVDALAGELLASL